MTRIKTFFVLTALVIVGSPLAAQQFEPPKLNAFEYEGLNIDFGAQFTQTFQSLSHRNAPTAVVPENTLADIGAGFTLATANAWFSADVAPATRVVVETYLSSRNHNDTWVKGGYLQIDGSPIDNDLLEMAMALTTLKVGMFMPNYGDAHFRRSDNGNTIGNPFVGNLVLDAFTTEIGGEAYFRLGPAMVMLGVTGGENKGAITDPSGRSLAFVAKTGFDTRFNEDLRVRLMASSYQNDNAGRATLFWGDRAGSAYWGVMDTAEQGNAWNGRINPRFTEAISALQINPFVKFGNLELFGVLERAKGRTAQEADDRTVTQYAGDAIYRLLDDQLYVGARYNTAQGEFSQLGSDQTVERTALAAGWFISPYVLLKGEFVTQGYSGFDSAGILAGGAFDGFVVQGSVAF